MTMSTNKYFPKKYNIFNPKLCGNCPYSRYTHYDKTGVFVLLSRLWCKFWETYVDKEWTCAKVATMPKLE